MLRYTRRRAAALIAVAASTAALAACGDEPDTRVTHEPVVVTPVAPAMEPPSTPALDPNVSFEQAESTYKTRKYDEATEMFAAYTARRPDNPWGHYMLGLSSWKSGQLDRGRAAFESALALDPTHVKSIVNLSRVLLEQDRPNEALARLREAVVVDSTNGDVWRVLGRVHGALGNVDEAVSAYRTALAIDPDDTWAMNNMGLVLIRAGRYDDALLPLARAVQLDDVGVPQFLNNLGIALERTGRYSQAEKQYRLALESDSGYAKAKVSLDRVAGRTDLSGVPTVEISTLGDSFAATVSEWRTARGLEAAARQPVDSAKVELEQQVSEADTTTTPR